MAADAYLKVASGQLQQAIAALKQEASTIRGQATPVKLQLEKEITAMQAEMTAKRLQSQNPNLDKNVTIGYAQDANRLDTEIAAKRKELDNQLQQIEQSARSKESAAQSLTGQISSLDALAADPRMQ